MDFKIIFLIITSQGRAEQEVLLEGYSRDITCGTDKVIKIISIPFKKYSPRCIVEVDGCSEAKSMVFSDCNGKNKCYLQLTEAIRSTCQNTWVRLEYDCDRRKPLRQNNILWYWHQYVCSYNDECADSNDVINLQYSNNWRIECDKQPFYSLQSLEICIRHHLLSVCLERQGCDWPWRRSTSCCFSFPSVMTVVFSCTNELIISNNTFNATTSSESQLQTKIPDSSLQHSAKLNTTNNEEVTDVILTMDKESRILLFNSRENKTYSICGHQWDDKKASVVCRYLNVSLTGKASTVPKNKNYTRIVYAASCTGNETDLFECKFDSGNSSKDICKAIDDAAVHCLPTNPEIDNKDVTTVDGKIGLIIALSSASTLAVAVVAVFCMRQSKRRSYKHNENYVQHANVEGSSSGLHIGGNLKADNRKYELSGSRENLSNNISGEIIGKVSIIPTSDSAYFVVDPKETVFNRTHNPDSHKLNEDQDGDNYATSVEGVYDEMNNRRHTENNDVNMYSHSVDDVYDVSAHNRQSQNDPTYNQFSGMDLENDYM